MDNKLYNLLAAKQNTLAAFLGESGAIPHPTGNGDNSEKSWKNFLEEILPRKYGIDKGYVIDYEGNVSEQIDLIIYDALYSPFVLISKTGEKFIPAEAVYAIVEVKPNIDKENIEYANNKIQTVKNLKRSSRGMTCAGKRTEKRSLTHILGILLATKMDIVNDSTIINHLENNKNIDLGCAINGYSFISIKKKDGSVKFEKTSENEAILGLFFNLNNELHEIGTVAAIDIRKYANALNSFNFNTEEDFREDE